MEYLKRVTIRIVLGFIGLTVSVWALRADDTKPAPLPAVRSVTIPAPAVEIYNEAAKRTVDARKAVEESVIWKNYQLAQAQEQTTILYALAEAGLKPSDGCKPIFDKDNKLQSFECPIAKEVKPKEAK